MKKIIEVAQVHIDKGVIGNPKKCPIALALMYALGTYVFVWYDVVRIGRRSIPLSTKAIEFIDRFDDRKHVKPFKFQVGSIYA